MLLSYGSVSRHLTTKEMKNFKDFKYVFGTKATTLTGCSLLLMMDSSVCLQPNGAARTARGKKEVDEVSFQSIKDELTVKAKLANWAPK